MNAVFFFDFPFDIGTLPYIIGFLCLLFVAIVFYIFYLKPRMTVIFPEETHEGPWTVPLSRLGWTAEGEVCGARHVYEAWFSKLISNTVNKDDADRILALRDDILKTFMFAQRSQYGDLLYLFDKNPLDPKYHIPTGPHRFIGPVQDCKSGGKDAYGLDVISVKLGTETAKFSDDERKSFDQREEGVKAVRLAAANSGKIKYLEDVLGDKELIEDQLFKTTRKLQTEKDTSKLGSGITPLTTPGLEPPKPGVLSAIGRKFLSKSQLIIAFISIGTWFGLTNILRMFDIVVPDPNSIGLIAGVALFFGVPIIRGWWANR
jgi:hypothetical protein